VAKLVRKEMERSVHRPLVEDIKSRLNGFGVFAVKHVWCSGNELPHRIAKDGRDTKLCRNQVSVCPGYGLNFGI
jgi:hypothetical protein